MYFNFLSDDEVELTFKDSFAQNSDRYVGDFVIPSTISYQGKTYAVTSVGHYAFYGCDKLKSVVVPEGVSYVGGWAFEDCVNLASVSLPESLTQIGSSAFRNCGALPSLRIPSKVELIGNTLFQNCEMLSVVTLSESLNEIPNYVFSGCKSLTAITIPDKVTGIGAFAFEECSKLESVQIGSSVGNINWGAFKNCSSLKSIHLPECFATLDIYVFEGCSALEEVQVDALTPPGAHDNSFDTSTYETAKLTVPAESEFAYSEAPAWRLFNRRLTGISSVASDVEDGMRFDLNGVRTGSAKGKVTITVKPNGETHKTISLK